MVDCTNSQGFTLFRWLDAGCSWGLAVILLIYTFQNIHHLRKKEHQRGYVSYQEVLHLLIYICKKNVISFIMLLYSIMYDHHALKTARPVAIPLRTVGLQRKSASSEIAPGGIGFYINFLAIHKGVSKNRGTPKSSILIGFSIIFTIHFGVPLFLETPIKVSPLTFWFQSIPNHWVSRSLKFSGENTACLAIPFERFLFSIHPF